MVARSVDEASIRLRKLRHAEREDLGLGAVALGLALVATHVYPPLAIPLFVGGLGVGALGVRAMWSHWDLVDRLAGDPDAYTITEVRAHAEREATMERRRSYAAVIRSALAQRTLDVPPSSAEGELAELASELEDEELALDPASAVACGRLVGDPDASPLLNASLPLEELHARVVQIRAGFGPRSASA